MSSGPLRWGVLATGGIASAFTAALRRMPDAERIGVRYPSEEAAPGTARA